jgi:hypothetical protein
VLDDFLGVSWRSPVTVTGSPTASEATNIPWFTAFTHRRLRQEYPGVPPWEWDAHPEWRERVICTLRAEDAADEIKAERFSPSS